jgi:predicted transcriptional regulator
MREDVTKNGIPLYKSGGEVEVRPTTKDETIQRKIPEMEAAAKALQAGVIDRKEYDRVVKKHKPVKPYDFIPQPASDEDADRALMENKKPQWRGHSKWPAGRKVGLRLDIPAYEQHGVWVNSIHDEEGREGDKLKTSYAPVSSVKNATFDAGPEKAIKVATGEQNKSPFARIKGELHHMSEDEAVEHMKAHLNNPEYAQVGMDPRRHGFFYDRKTMKPVTHSEHVVQIGPLVLAKNPKYGKRDAYAKGGSVMGINVASDRKSDRKYADMIVDGHKTFESRNSDTLRPYVGKRVAIVRTGEGKAKAIGEVTIGEPTVVNKQKFRALEDKHHVPEGSAFDIGNNTKHLYPLSDPVRYEQERDVGHGIVARKVLAHGGAVSRETIKPISHGIIKERVTVSPDKDVMQYELMSAKHFTKKVK